MGKRNPSSEVRNSLEAATLIGETPDTWSPKQPAVPTMWYGLLPCLEEMPLPTKYILKASPLREVNIHETNAAQYHRDCGAGVGINDPSARMRYCTVGDSATLA